MADEIIATGSRVVYENRWMTVREDTIRRADGSAGIYGIVDKAPYAMVVPFDGECFHMVEQYRYPAGRRFWEFPQGAWEDEPGADPTAVAAGELAEETGVRAGSMVELGVLFQAYGYSTQRVHVFLATDLTEGPQDLAVEEQGLVRGSFGLDEFDAMVADGRIQDLTSVAAAYLFRRG